MSVSLRSARYCRPACVLLVLASPVSTAAGSVGADALLPGGSATYTGPIDSGAFTHPSSTPGAEALDRFEKGRDLFNRSWGDGTGRTPGQALGPLYNARSCRT
ncbi:MAG: hypothetical protein DWQ08_08415, partial [Proteobacteria bacterium]